ncbi:translational activator of cytochrome c oxidase 1-like [Eleutherodactylus coqui]|uniref:translational activator of cytochrome c oxidase 1-like n=1 Tax=Eleutherodactylus coqui TaxID=57060 RepID=UPI003461DBB0
MTLCPACVLPSAVYYIGGGLDRSRAPALRPQEVAVLHTSAVASAGHNKWSKVRHIKGPKDAARSRVFAKLTMMIKAAVREGGPNPDFNPYLYQLVEQGRQRNMPKTSIEAAINPLTFEGVSLRPGSGVLGQTDRGADAVCFRINLKIGTHTDALHCFDKKGVVIVQSQDQDGKPLRMEQTIDLAIQAGAEDVQETQDEEEEKDVYKRNSHRCAALF